jgi:flagellar protein FliL
MAESTSVTKRRGGATWVLLVAGVVLLAGLAGAASILWPRSGAASPASAVQAARTASGIVPLESFLVNLADPQAQRFARVTVRLIVDTKEDAGAIAADPVRQARLRSAVLEILTLQTTDRLVTADGKAELKKAIAERGSGVLGQQVRDVLFTDFVVQ